MENTDDLKNFSNLAKNLQTLETLPIVKQNTSFSHTGFLEANDYKYGYPTLNPLNINDKRRYDQAISLFEELAKRTMRANEPKIE